MIGLRRAIERVTKILKRSVYTPLELAMKQGVRFGRGCQLNGGVDFGSEPYLVAIGDNFYSSSNIQFVTHDGSVNVLRNLYPELRDADLIKPISVGNNVFLGYGVVVLPGTVIEDNVIVGAHSVVRGTLRRDSVYAGNPVKYLASLEEYLDKNRHDFMFTKRLSKARKREALEAAFRFDEGVWHSAL